MCFQETDSGNARPGRAERGLVAPVIRVMVIYIALAHAVPAHAVPAHADSSVREPVPMFNLTAGYFGIVDNIAKPLRFGAEYRFAELGKWKLIPSVGLVVAQNGAYFVYSDLRYDFWLNDKWLLIPSFGLGAFNGSEQLQLGNKLEFRSGIEIAYRFHKKYRLGVAFFHISNGGIADKNPGTEVLVLSLSIPVSLGTNEHAEQTKRLNY